jgi:hypothetical protein
MTITYEDILKAKSKGPEALNEASLGRVYQHVKKSGAQSYAILTSWRSQDQNGIPVPRPVNLANFKKLKGQLQALGLGFFPLVGSWEDDQTGEVASEPSLFVLKITAEQVKKFRAEYDQDAVLYSGPDTKGDVVLFRRSGESEKIGAFQPGKIAAVYSKVKGRPFIFECPAENYSQALLQNVHKLRGFVK